MKFRRYIRLNFQALCFALFSTFILFVLHHLPVNQIFIDPFSEAIKQHDVMDIAFSKFRDHNKIALFDTNIVVLNSGITNRANLAKTITLLNAYKVRAMGIDLLFDTMSTQSPKADTLLQSAIKRSKNLVLGYYFIENKHGDNKLSFAKTKPFFSANTKQGYVNLATNDNFSVRAYEPYHQFEKGKEPAFSTQIALTAFPEYESRLTSRNSEKQWINFRRVQPGAVSMIHPINSGRATHYTLMDIDVFLRDSSLYKENNYFKNKVVIIGFVGESEKALSMEDRYFTPLNEQYTGRSKPDMSGIFIHANILSMVFNNDFIDDIPEWVLYLIAIFIFYLNYLVFSRILSRLKPAGGVLIRLIQVLEFSVLFTISVVLLVKLNMKLSFFLIATSVILSFELFEIYERRLEHSVDLWISKVRNRLKLSSNSNENTSN